MATHTVQSVLDTLSHVKRFQNVPVLVKIGGAALENPTLLKQISEDLALIRKVGVPLVVVHGGGPAINEELTLHGLKWDFVDGLRVTTPEMMKVVEMVLCGSVNQRLVRSFNQAGMMTVGLSGSDAGMFLCKPMKKELGLVGEITEVNPRYVEAMLLTQSKAGAGFVPVVAPVGFGKKGEAYNVNADWSAVRLAESLQFKKVIFMTDQDGILDADQKIISELDSGGLETLCEQGTVKGGMLAKSRTIIHALKHGVEHVHILNAKRAHCLIEELFTSAGIGTICRTRSSVSSTLADRSAESTDGAHA